MKNPEEPLKRNDPEWVAWVYELFFCKAKREHPAQDHDWTEHIPAAATIIFNGKLVGTWDMMRRLM